MQGKGCRSFHVLAVRDVCCTLRLVTQLDPYLAGILKLSMT